MIKKIDTYLFGNIPFSCESKFPLEDSVIRLKENTKRSVFSALFKQRAVGKVSVLKVRLQRVIPFFGNSFKPILVGKFKEENGRVYLDGKFTTFLLSKIFMAVWFSFALLWTALAIIQVAQSFSNQTDRPFLEAFLFPVGGIVFIGIGILFIKLCWRLSAKDIDYLKKVVVEALTNGSYQSAGRDAETAARPTAARYVCKRLKNGT